MRLDELQFTVSDYDWRGAVLFNVSPHIAVILWRRRDGEYFLCDPRRRRRGEDTWTPNRLNGPGLDPLTAQCLVIQILQENHQS